jgi:hypothetical protein
VYTGYDVGDANAERLGDAGAAVQQVTDDWHRRSVDLLEQKGGA